jgi:adenosylcobinamide-GDP ribazoletransferase
MLLTLAFGEPADPRSSSVPFVRALSGPYRTPAVVAALLAPLPFLLATSPLLAPLAMLAVPLVGLGALRISVAKFGGIGGDVVGATGEVSRAALLVFLSATV